MTQNRVVPCNSTEQHISRIGCKALLPKFLGL